MLDPTDRERLCVVLVRTRNPLNIGAVARVMSNFGFLQLHLVQPFEPSFREARSAVGAADLLKKAKVFNTVAEAIQDCSLVVGTSAVRDREVHQRIKMLADGASEMRASLKKQRVALLFGSEKTGLSTADLSHCNLLLRIPTRVEHVSLNLAQAVAVTLYETVREPLSVLGGPPKQSIASAEDQERMTSVLMQSLIACGYVKGSSLSASELKIRRLVKRMSLNPKDAELWVGMLKKMLGEMRRK